MFFFVIKELDDVIWLHVPATRPIRDDLQIESNVDSINGHSEIEDNVEEQKKLNKTLELDRKQNEGEVREYGLDGISDLLKQLMLETGEAESGRSSIEQFTTVCKLKNVQ